MNPDWSVLAIDPSGIDCNRLLSSWRWLVNESYVPIELTIFGDWFLLAHDGAVFLLDVVAGELRQIAESKEQFAQERSTREALDDWFMADLAMLCWEQGLRPEPGQCLSYKVPPVLSGELALSNIEVCDLAVHQSIMAQMHEQVRDLPPDTQINRIIVDGETPS